MREHHCQLDDSLRCSFCRKSQASVRKLISGPSDSPRAYICNECVEVCTEIIDDERPGETEPSVATEGPHPLLSHPLASELVEAVVLWFTQDSLDPPALVELDHLRAVAARMLQSERGTA